MSKTCVIQQESLSEMSDTTKASAENAAVDHSAVLFPFLSKCENNFVIS